MNASSSSSSQRQTFMLQISEGLHSGCHSSADWAWAPGVGYDLQIWVHALYLKSKSPCVPARDKNPTTYPRHLLKWEDPSTSFPLYVPESEAVRICRFPIVTGRTASSYPILPDYYRFTITLNPIIIP
ncbi:Hypothetical protein NTJ_10762 [Nesidiocoris tenuis]|uniref:Uncharacterized protein n=1 Tax=Nesidiocoris tenuis TaxID=355587 RepID=A0ABN7B0I1_9HEMI|nr:Hypothetical protein NTJ_10762 [Nesidiocoris tenuis]